MTRFITWDDLKSWKRICCLTTIFVAFLFLILTFIAIFTYPIPYDFGGHHFSSLGLTQVKVGILYLPNQVSFVLFFIAIMAAAIGLIPFWILIRELFVDNQITKKISLIGTILGVLSSILLMGVVIFPADVAQLLHSGSANGFFLFFATSIVLYSIAIFLNDNYPNQYAFLGVGISILVVLYVFGAFEFADALFQKICVYSFIIWAFIQVFKVWQEVGP